jgi:Uma2 family endonuclease
MVPRWDERRGQTWEKVPLTPWDVLHPEEEDFIVTSDAHDRDVHYLKDVFEDRTAGRHGALVLCDHRVLWGPPELGAHGPDVIVLDGLSGPWDPRRGTFPVAEMGARPVVVVEVTSPSTRDADLDEKVTDYFKAGVPLYIIADHRDTANGAFVRLTGHRATPDGYVRVAEDPRGVWVEALKVWVGSEGDLVVCRDENGDRIADMHLQRDAEKARADAEKARAEAEKARADAAEQRLRELEAELKRLRGETN